jgi:hypothetical protein
MDIESTRRDLIAMRVKFGALTQIGRRCSNLISQLQNYESAKGKQRANLEKTIREQMDDLTRLTSR